MAIASFLTPKDVIEKDLRISTAGVADVQFYNAAAYRRMDQVFKGDQDGTLINTLFPKATIELLLLLEEAWWPSYIQKAAGTVLYTTGPNGQLVTGFKPANLVKTNQWLIEAETFLVVKNFYASVINDNANINEKDKFNFEEAANRFSDKWSAIMQATHFYDVNLDGVISKIEENLLFDANYYSDNTRFF